MTLHSSVDEQVLKRQHIHQRLQNILYTLLAIAVACSMVILYLQNLKLADLANSTRASAGILVQCTTPPELRHPPVVLDKKGAAQDCYARTRAETGQVVSNIRTISIAAAACGAAHPGDVKETEDCVNKTLKNK
jgi:hypothetical protein